MIVYDLECENSHRFEGWFGSAGEFDDQLAKKYLTCPMCNSGNVVRRPSAAYVNTRESRESRQANPVPPGTELVPAQQPVPHSAPNLPQHVSNIPPEVVAKVIEHIVRNTEDVGTQFPEEARKIHYNEAPARHIRGTASARDVAELRDEGIEVVSLPVPAHLANKQH
jgi:hypothetical protein